MSSRKNVLPGKKPWLNLFKDNRDSEEGFRLAVIQREDDIVKILEVFFDKVEEDGVTVLSTIFQTIIRLR